MLINTLYIVNFDKIKVNCIKIFTISIIFLILLFIYTISIIFPLFVISAYGFGLDIHKDLTSKSLSFLNLEILSAINEGHDEADSPNPLYGHQFVASYHFDNCNFREGTEHINSEYTTRVVPNLDPKGFGVILHSAMDFYAHSNWVNIGKTNLIDNGNGLWRVLNPGDVIDGVIVLEGTSRDPGNINFMIPE